MIEIKLVFNEKRFNDIGIDNLVKILEMITQCKEIHIKLIKKVVRGKTSSTKIKRRKTSSRRISK